MATVTADFPTGPVQRSRVERIADGVVAEYIRTLNGTRARTPRSASTEPFTEQAAIVAADSSMVVTASRGQSHGPMPRPTSTWSRGVRGGCSNQVKRLFEAR
jgi:hypothetical protein